VGTTCVDDLSNPSTLRVASLERSQHALRFGETLADYCQALGGLDVAVRIAAALPGLFGIRHVRRHGCDLVAQLSGEQLGLFLLSALRERNDPGDGPLVFHLLAVVGGRCHEDLVGEVQRVIDRPAGRDE
jgi:hypothetical protein